MNPSIYGLYGQVPCPSRSASALFGLLLLQKHRANSFVLLLPIFGSFLTFSCPKCIFHWEEPLFPHETSHFMKPPIYGLYRQDTCIHRAASALFGLYCFKTVEQTHFQYSRFSGVSLPFLERNRFSRLLEPWFTHETFNL